MNIENSINENDVPRRELIFHIPKSLLEVKTRTESKISSKIDNSLEVDVVPFSALNIKNSSEVYKISKSFISDLEKNKKSFGFVSVGVTPNDLYLLGLASCLSYTRNNSSVLIIVRNLSNPEWNKYRHYFSSGKLGDWTTAEWGNLCLIDYKELALTSRKGQIDFKLIYSEFDAVFWSMPDESKVSLLKEVHLDILRSLDSVSLIIKPGNISAKDIKKVDQHYSSLGIPLKGIMKELGETV